MYNTITWTEVRMGLWKAGPAWLTTSPSMTVICLLNERKAVDFVSLDFSKIFDTVSHSILPEKPATHGLDWCTLHSVKNWLGGRFQRIIVSGSKSFWWPVKSGVFQGSIWVPVGLIEEEKKKKQNNTLSLPTVIYWRIIQPIMILLDQLRSN